MRPNQNKQGTGQVRVIVLGLIAAVLFAGCEVDSYFDPSQVGRWERTPVVLPILPRLDLIEDRSTEVPGLSPVLPEDRVPDVREYVIGPGDLVTVTVFELLVRGVESVQTRRVDELGMIRLPVVEGVKVAGLTASQVERRIAQILEAKNVLKEPTVTAIVQEGRQNTFSVIAESGINTTVVGTYQILNNDFRLLDAVALARGVPGQTKKIYVIRPAALTPPQVTPTPGVSPGAQAPTEPTRSSAELITDLMRGVEQPGTAPAPGTPGIPGTEPAPSGTTPPSGMESALETPRQAQPWVHVEGKGWVPATATQPVSAAEEAPPTAITQRVIEVPYDKLQAGDMSYNVVIRPGDIIRVPSFNAGNVYIMGQVNRPGVYLVPGDEQLTLKNLVAAAGGLSALAWPERADLIRRVGDNQEATVRVSLKAIFDGTQPDFYLKPNDQINVGTSFVAAPIAVFRNGLRASYGFGFVLDRNFADDVFGAQETQ